MSVVLDGGSVCLKMHFIVRHELYEARRIACALVQNRCHK